jgi:phosphoglycerol transferase MdoB-like AlkP superfamily enzyme
MSAALSVTDAVNTASAVPVPQQPRPRRSGLPHLRLAMSHLVLLVLLFGGLRLCLYLRNRELADGATLATIAGSFLVGLRFDLAVAAFLTFPLLLLAGLGRLAWGNVGEQRVYLVASLVYGVVLTIPGLAEVEFYREFLSRYNSLALHYWSQPATVLSQIWYGYPVIPYLLLAAALIAAYVGAVAWMAGRWLATRRPGGWRGEALGVARTALLVGLLVVVARGGVRGVPLQWGDAVHSQCMFANQLSQNGFWTLAWSLKRGTGAARFARMWPAPMPPDEAHRSTQRLLLLPQDELVDPTGRYPLLRRHLTGRRTVSLVSGRDDPPNVVVIIMESFSARFVGAVGSPDDCTPEFNRLARDGILFDRCFSAGTHTHQANVAVSAGFPNLPGYEALMQNYTDGMQPFDSLPQTLKRRGYATTFLYNGDFSWENMEGFFRVQGIDRFIGRQSFGARNYHDRTWGVSDKDLLDRADEEFGKAKGPFYATILTLSNHVPFDLPKPLPVAEVTGHGKMDKPMTGIRYADWAIGQFFQKARRQPYFRNTLFVLVGDHGFSVHPILTELRLLRFHVPLLFYAPDLLRGQARRCHTVAGQVDIAPTILGLLGDTGPHQHWGRDLFALPADDPGWAVFKPSEHSSNAGLVRGDHLLVRTEDGHSELYRYSLGFPPHVTRLDRSQDEVRKSMDHDLQAYLSTAVEVLTAHHAAADTAGAAPG